MALKVSVGRHSVAGSLGSVNIPHEVTNIGDFAFTYCASLVSIDIPDGVTSIGYNAFYQCPNLSFIVSPGSYAEQYAKWNDIPVRYR